MSATTFEEIRRQAVRKVADAEDWLRSDWSDKPTARQCAARAKAAHYLAEAHAWLDTAARTEREGAKVR